MIKSFDPVSTSFPDAKTKALPLTVLSRIRGGAAMLMILVMMMTFYWQFTTYNPKMQAVTWTQQQLCSLFHLKKKAKIITDQIHWSLAMCQLWSKYYIFFVKLNTCYHTLWASQVSQLQRINLPMQETQETQVQSLGWEKEVATQSVLLPGKFYG